MIDGGQERSVSVDERGRLECSVYHGRGLVLLRIGQICLIQRFNLGRELLHVCLRPPEFMGPIESELALAIERAVGHAEILPGVTSLQVLLLLMIIKDYPFNRHVEILSFLVLSCFVLILDVFVPF